MKNEKEVEPQRHEGHREKFNRRERKGRRGENEISSAISAVKLSFSEDNEKGIR